MIKSVHVMIGAATLAVAGASGAADRNSEAERIREIASRYATCVIAQSSHQARRYLVEEGQPPITGECLVRATRGLGGQMRFPGQNYRYALAGALLMRDFPAGVPARTGTAPQLAHETPDPLDEAKLPGNARKAAAVREAYSRRRSVWLMGMVGDCTARANPDGAYALVRSEVGGAAERTAFGALKPAIASCLPRDATIHFDPAALRGTIALNLYRLAYSVRTPGNA